MMLDDRLRRLADHIDARLDDELDLDLVVRGDDHAATESRRRSRAVAIATAAVIVAGAAGLTVVTRHRPPSVPAAASDDVADGVAHTAPSPAPVPARVPTAFPTVDRQVDGAGEPEGSYAMFNLDGAQRVDALIGVVTDTSLTGGIEVQVVAGNHAETAARMTPAVTVRPEASTTTSTSLLPASVPGSEVAEPPTTVDGSAATAEPPVTRETAQLWGHEADVYTMPGTPRLRTVVIDADVAGQPVTLQFTGLDPLGILSSVDQFVEVVAVAGSSGAGVPQFTIRFAGPMPDGYRVVVEPTATVASSMIATLSINNTADVEGNLVQVTIYDPLPGLAAAGSLTAVDVNGTPGWMSDGAGHAVTWRVDDQTVALVGGSASADEALTVADSISFVDEATWRGRYHVAQPDFGTGLPPTTTALPSIPGPSSLPTR